MLKQIRWDEVAREQLSPQLQRQFFTAGGVTVARFHMRQGLQIPTHHHESGQITNIVHGAVRMWVEGNEYLLREGDIICIPGGTPHHTQVLEDTIVLDVFSPPRTDWLAGEDAYLRSVASAEAVE
jgi:quercetin dioxygenase-like cupin family protein